MKKDGMMKRAVILGDRKVILEEVPIPQPKEDQVLVRIRSCALCTWEQRTYTGVDSSSAPLLGGHEFAGVVEAIGPEVYSVQVGDHVAVSGLTHCGQCYSCRRGLTHLCDNLTRNWVKGQPNGPGGLGEYVLVRGYQVFRIDPEITFEEAALIEPLSCVLRSYQKANVQPGDYVVVIGAGIMGLLHILLAKGGGATVIVSEIEGVRRQKAQELGAHYVVDPQEGDFVARIKELTEGHGPEVTFVAIGIAPAIEQALKFAAKGGRVMVYAAVHPKDSTITINPNLFHNREIVLTGTVGQTKQDFERAAELISRRIIDVRPLISARYSLEEITEAFEASLRKDTYRVLVNP
ncbi:MAG: zinc-binding dehydrogenase [Chloroflexi bacterium]|nr:zinc-binding dehydrogenase [Chloroflexota bacterium]